MFVTRTAKLTTSTTPIINAVGGFLAGVLIATVYNFSARWTGGIEIVLDETT